MIGLGVIELALLFGFPTNLPLAVPPGPYDMRIAAVAPEECLVFLSWAGTAKASSEGTNHTERLMADPEIRRCLDDLKARLKAMAKQGAGQGDRAKIVAEEAPKIVEITLTHPTAFFVESVAPKPPAVDVSAALVIHLGDREKEFVAAWTKIEEALGQKSLEGEGKESNWRFMPAPQAAGIVARWTTSDGYFVLAFGEKTGPIVLERLKQEKPPQWFVDIRKRLDVPRVSTVNYVNVKGILRLANASIAQADPRQAQVMEKLGINKITSFAAVSGLDETGCVNRSLLQFDGRPAIFLKMLDSKPLGADDLKAIPADAMVAAAAKFDAERTIEEFLKLVDTLGPRPGTRDEMTREFDAMSSELGFSIREDLIPALGDSWRIYHSPGEGGSLLTNWTAVISVRDPKKMGEIATVLAFKAREARRQQRELNAGQRNRFVTVEQMKSGEHEISYMNFVGDSSPVAPAWCFNGKELVLSTFPQGVQSYLERGSGAKTLADLPDVAARLKDGPAPLAFVRYDTAELAKVLYPVVQHFANMAIGELQRQGVDVNITLLPRLPALLRHLQPATTSVIATDDGVELVSRRTLPVSIGPVSTLVPALFGLRSGRMGFGGGPAPFSLIEALSPERAMRTKSMNNLKQFGLAMHNAHDTFGKFPAAASTGRGTKPLLSWRVQILPFIEQAQLFNEFKQDEPWDSEHNKKLIARMPEIYRAPGSRAEEGKTTYVTMRGPNTIFPGTTATRIQDVTDGTSNTILLVEASDKAAVTWTKPDDIDLDEKDPIKNLVGLRRDGFLAAMADGSVRFISSKIDAQTLLNLFLRNDGNVIGEF